MDKKVFGYPIFDKYGEMILTTYDNEYRDMLMDIRVYRMKRTEIRLFESEEEEIAVLLLQGQICWNVDGIEDNAERKSVFIDGPYAAHVSKGKKIIVEAIEETEILVQKTNNKNDFKSVIYSPENVQWIDSWKDELNNTACRRVGTIFDYSTEPNSHMVLGEVLNDPGNWSGYPPHRHVQPECYYFLFDYPEGFGASFVGDKVFKSVNRSFSAIPGGQLHPQSVAPGFQMYTCWMIRHLDDNPWLQTSRCVDEKYTWLHKTVFDEKTNAFKKNNSRKQL